MSEPNYIIFKDSKRSDGIQRIRARDRGSTELTWIYIR